MSKKLVAYFSASGVTGKVAANLAEAVGADLYEIAPETKYSGADLDWTNSGSRCCKENADPNSRPVLKDKKANIGQYETIFLGFPIWWYLAPHIINSYLESGDFAGKNIALFATSGGSGMGDTESHLKKSAPGAVWKGAKKFSSSAGRSELAAWAKGLGL